MPKSVISYDGDLPEITGRFAWLKPTSYLLKDASAPSGWREETSGRRPSKLLLVKKLRAAVDAWRDGGYAGASKVTRRLFEHWFEEDHEVPGFPAPFHYHFCQREAIETLAYIVESGRPWKYNRVNQSQFDARQPTTLAEAVKPRLEGQRPLL